MLDQRERRLRDAPSVRAIAADQVLRMVKPGPAVRTGGLAWAWPLMLVRARLELADNDGAHGPLQPADRADGTTAALVGDQIGRAAIGAAEQSLGGGTAQATLGVAAPAQVRRGA